jgi:plastocyanin
MQNTFKPASANLRCGVATIAVSFCGVLVTMLCLSAVWPVLANAAGRTHLVVMEGMKFSPPTLRIQSGDTVVFKNNDLVPHTATAKKRGVFDSGIITPGESWTLAPTFQATVSYVCTFHPMMEGRIEMMAAKEPVK